MSLGAVAGKSPPSMTSPTIGLLGGGQLGLMLCEAAAPLNIPIAILDAADAPAKKINSNKHHVTGSFKDAAKIRELAAHADVLTVETEHIDTHILEEIATQGVRVRAADGTTTTKRVPVHPSWRTLRLVQNKYEQKEYFAQRGIPVAEQVAVEPGEAMLASMKMASERFGYPWMLKARRDSYDGRGNIIIRGEDDLVAAAADFGRLECYAERWVPFETELSVVVIRTEYDDGSTKTLTPYPVVETVHEDNVCSRVYFPPRGVGMDLCRSAQDIASSVVGKLWGRGVFAVEMFVTKAGDVLVNEVAPRPHNSGHLFIEAVPYMSQYKAQLAAILNDPLPVQLDPLVHSSMMINILGGAGPDSHLPLVKAAKGMFKDNVGVYLHLYGKEAKPGRKIGHITLTGLEVGLDVLERFAQPLVDLAEEMRQERLQAAIATLRPEQAVQPVAAVECLQLKKEEKPLVLVTMGSDSDLPVLRAGIDVLNRFGVPWEVDITSAHRTPAKMARVASEAAGRGIKVIIAAAGGAAHLPGMLAAYTPLPVIGVPVKATHLDGIDSLLSIVQMPRGVPTATVAINNSTNAALLAVRILGAFTPDLLDRMKEYQQEMEGQVEDKAGLLQEMGVEAYLAKMGK